MAEGFKHRVSTFEKLGHKGPITGWQEVDFLPLEEATIRLPIKHIQERKL